jgi:hypothetical protein
MKHICDMCRQKKASPGFRYCARCKSLVLAKLERKGYFVDRVKVRSNSRYPTLEEIGMHGLEI